MIKTVDGKEVPAIVVFSTAIRYMRLHLTNTLHIRSTQLRETEILWVVTVPAIWDDSAKQFMREAAFKASIALSPELFFSSKQETSFTGFHIYQQLLQLFTIAYNSVCMLDPA